MGQNRRKRLPVVLCIAALGQRYLGKISKIMIISIFLANLVVSALGNDKV